MTMALESNPEKKTNRWLWVVNCEVLVETLYDPL